MGDQRHFLDKVVSGGQDGADRAGLEAAARLGLRTGGWAPAGFRTAHGPEPTLARFGLCALPAQGTVAQQYAVRSMRNVDEADATVAFRLGPSVGTDRTIGYAATRQWRSLRRPEPPASLRYEEIDSAHRPVFVVRSLDEPRGAAIALAAFIQRRRVKALNVCGHRAWPAVPNFGEHVQSLLAHALRPFSAHAWLMPTATR